jgi:hypothetical protein
MTLTIRRFVLAVSAAMVPASAASAGDDGLAFSNQTAAAGVTMTHDTSVHNLHTFTGAAAVGDFNNDGWQDIFVLGGGGSYVAPPPGPGGLPGADCLFINNGDGTFTDRAAAALIHIPHRGKAVATGDFDGDGWLDLFITSAGQMDDEPRPGRHLLYRNNRNGTFSDYSFAAGVRTTTSDVESGISPCFGDYDLDGDLDLFVCGVLFSPPPNRASRLYRNEGDGTFTDVTTSIGLFDGIGNVAALSSMFVDMDGDRYPELLIAGDFGFQPIWEGSKYFRNNAGVSFTDITVASGTGLDENGMGHCVGDFDNDGRLDWYVTSIYQPSISWTGNKLFMATGAHQFAETSVAAGVSDGGFGWGTIAVDFDHDGDQDIAETNGDAAGSGTFFQEQAYLWLNDGDGTFTEQAIARGFAHHDEGRAMLNLDYDNDGDQDVVIASYNGPLILLRNDLSGPATNWLRVFLDTNDVDDLAPNGFGARVLAVTGGTTQTRVITGGSNFIGVSELSAHFGLGADEIVDELRVIWPNGDVSVFEDVAANRTVTVRAGSPCLDDGSATTDCDGNGRPDDCDIALDPGADGNGNGVLDECEPNPDVNSDGQVNLFDLVVVILNFGPCPAPPTCLGDADRSGRVDIDDIIAVVLNWSR